MPSPDPAKRKAAMAAWYQRNREAHKARVTRDRRARRNQKPITRPSGSLHVEGWQDRLRYGMRIAHRRYPRLFERAHDDVEQAVSLTAITHTEIGKPFSRAVQRALYRLEREIL